MDKEDEKYYISVVDILLILSESKESRKYWNKLKQYLKEEGNETVTNCHGLKLKVDDGKYRMTNIEVTRALADLGEIVTKELANHKA